MNNFKEESQGLKRIWSTRHSGAHLQMCTSWRWEAGRLQQVWNRPGPHAGSRSARACIVTLYFKWESFLFYFLINGKTQIIYNTNRICSILFSLTKHAREEGRKRERKEIKGGTPGSKFILHPLILKELCEGFLKAIARTQIIINSYYGMLKEKPEVGQRHGVLELRKPALWAMGRKEMERPEVTSRRRWAEGAQWLGPERVCRDLSGLQGFCFVYLFLQKADFWARVRVLGLRSKASVFQTFPWMRD